MKDILDTKLNIEIEGDINLIIKTNCFELQMYGSEKVHSFNYTDVKEVHIISGFAKATPLSIIKFILGSIIGIFLSQIGDGDKEKDLRIDLTNGKGLIFHFQDKKKKYKKAIELINLNLTEANKS
jgi:hypothetical protein